MMIPSDHDQEANFTTKQETTTSDYTIRNIHLSKATSSSTTTTTTSSWTRLKDPRIVRVSRALGGKDRHSKVCTVRGLRDRRVRLSVPTAIQLYDLQDRLGLNQPSKVVDWLLNVAKREIDELPPLQFPQGSLISPNLHPMMSFQDFTASNSGQSSKQGLNINSRSTNKETSDDHGNEGHHERRFGFESQGDDQLNTFLLSRQNNPSFSNNTTNYNSFGRWDPSDLTLNHHHHHQPSISLGLTAQNDHQDLHNFSLVYHQPEISAQPYFPQTNTDFNPKEHDFQISSGLSNSVRPFQFSMTANLLHSQNNAISEENKQD